MEYPRKKSERLLRLELLLRSHPEGLRRSEIARILHVHRSTVGRDIIDLSPIVPIWEENFRIGVKAVSATDQYSYTLYESVLFTIAIRFLAEQSSLRDQYVSSFIRKTAQTMKSNYPKVGELMTGSINILDMQSSEGFKYDDQIFRKLVDAWCSGEEIAVWFDECTVPLIPKQFFISQYQSGDMVILLEGYCKKGNANCIHNINSITGISSLSDADTEESFSCPQFSSGDDSRITKHFSARSCLHLGEVFEAGAGCILVSQNGMNERVYSTRYRSGDSVDSILALSRDKFTTADSTTGSRRMSRVQENGSSGLSLLIVDDEEQVLESLTDYFSMIDVTVTTAGSPKEAQELLLSSEFSIILTDLTFPDSTGYEILYFQEKKKKRIPVIFMSGEFNSHNIISAFRLGAKDFFIKPFEYHLLKESILRWSKQE